MRTRILLHWNRTRRVIYFIPAALINIHSTILDLIFSMLLFVFFHIFFTPSFHSTNLQDNCCNEQQCIYDEHEVRAMKNTPKQDQHLLYFFHRTVVSLNLRKKFWFNDNRTTSPDQHLLFFNKLPNPEYIDDTLSTTSLLVDFCSFKKINIKITPHMENWVEMK